MRRWDGRQTRPRSRPCLTDTTAPSTLTHSLTSPAAEKTTTGWCRIHWTIHTFNRVHDEKSHKITTLTIVEHRQIRRKKINMFLYSSVINILCDVIADERTHTQPFNGPLSRTTRVSQCQKGKVNLDFTEARDREWQWHHLGCMQVCTSLETDNHASTPPLSFFRPDALPATHPTASKHWRQ